MKFSSSHALNRSAQLTLSLRQQMRSVAAQGLALTLAVGCGRSNGGANSDASQVGQGGSFASGGRAFGGGPPAAGGHPGSGTTVILTGGANTGNPSVGGVTGLGGGIAPVGSPTRDTSSGGERTVGGGSGRPTTGGRTNTEGLGRDAGSSSAPAATGGSTSTTSALTGMVDASHVRLLAGSPFYDRQQLHKTGHLASWNPDRLLYPYRSLAKLPQAGGITSGYAGWDSSFLVGHMLGHYLSAASRMAAATGDTAYIAKATYVVAELAKCQNALGTDGYLAGFPKTVFDWLEGKGTSNNGVVVPYYTVHKIMAGLLDAHHYVGSQEALSVVTKMADYFQTRLVSLPAATLERIFRTDGSGNPQNEFGAMSDVFAELSTVTGNSKYLEAAKLFNRSWFIAPLAAGQDNLKGLHANTHIAEALGIAHTANLSRDSASLEASENFWKLLTGKHAFVTGGNSFREWLDTAGVEAGPSVDGGVVLPPTTAETCNTHNMLKLTSTLFVRTMSVGYADYHERALYNHILASVAPDTGNVTYFTPLYGNFRTYLDGTFCCSGTGLENTARYNEGIYFERGSSLWINLFIPSVLTWDATGLTIQQEGNAAAGETVRITVAKAAGETQATLNLRIPYWVSAAPIVTINGVQEQSVATNAYYAISRKWKVGDVIALELQAALRLEHAQDVSSMVAVFHGPILLAGALGSTNMPNDWGDKDANLKVANVAVPTIANASNNPVDWLEPVAGAPLTFKVHSAGAANGITFQPLYQTHHQRYSVYWPH